MHETRKQGFDDSELGDDAVEVVRLLVRRHHRQLRDAPRDGLLQDVGLKLLRGAGIHVLHRLLCDLGSARHLRLHGGLHGHLEVLLVLGDAVLDLLDDRVGLLLVLLGLCEAGRGLIVLGDSIVDVGLDLLLAGGHGLAQDGAQKVEKAGDDDDDVDDAGLGDVQVDGEAATKLDLAEVQQALRSLLRLLREGRQRSAEACETHSGAHGCAPAGGRHKDVAGAEKRGRGTGRGGGQGEDAGRGARHG
mmetsp:Transcript_88243/g.252855  ORF Transcript_88243/g.252855 Transcript_88243/m.252855 type:complete len:247 (-) Transcript_88243:87-827(-)